MKKAGSATDPLWFKDAIIYEVHVKAFADSNGDGMGDFPGLTARLDYLYDLGVTCIWVLPFFPSPLRDDGYDIANYVEVNPMYGTLDDFKAFLAAAHQRGLQVMIELVINHTSDQHPWFQRARRAPVGSPERDMYVWSDTDQKFDGVRIIFTDTERSNWTWDEEAGAYYWHRFFSHQPDLNFDNPRVLEEVLCAMRFWLDMGVDGLRLDAIPYLVERDGTSCENLSETHEVIKKIRAAIDVEYSNRLVLAEANMWPADVRPYFGEGDECHMAFHFPLMPRIYMALRQEDRLPITEIMAQTPDIPESCQWGLFLRNHDELTLEMVTNEERDYMYFAYSADPRMRINVGIRRRLAPLLDNNRRRVELLNSILFSFPGTPILYYGDEIGMGDNIYLGDRNGVRTPMQWNSDRNAGFSRATPARLYSPLIMDPVWGYQAINVEAQEGDSSSLLHWTRNMIALRKLFQVFGRGSLEFLKPENRKVLAYVREYQDERVLCVANLSRFAQPVSLDLVRWQEKVPVEMLGYVAFPPIKSEPYSITLGPYAFLWLELQDPAPQTVASTPTTQEILIPGNNLNEILAGPGRELLQESILPAYLSQQRWFGSKARTIKNLTIYDWSSLPPEDSALMLLDVSYNEGDVERYAVPVAMSFDVSTIEERFVIGNVSRDIEGLSRRGYLIDGLALESVRGSLLNLIGKGETSEAQNGAFTGVPGSVLAEQKLPSSSRLSRTEQSNSSIFFEDSLILKLFRHVQPGINPDVEIGRFLTEQAGFEHTPVYAGEIRYRANDSKSEPSDLYVLALLQGQVKNLGDGWSWTLSELQSIGNSSNAEEETSGYEAAARLLALRTAQMHDAFDRANTDGMRSRPATREDLAADSLRLKAQMSSTLLLLRHQFGDLPDSYVEEAAALIARRREMETFVEVLASISPEKAGSWMRIHGDYHLGQVLRTDSDFVILDFEGEPLKPLEERRRLQSPLRDVAGMMRSFDYVAAVYQQEAKDATSWLPGWERSTKDAYLNTYLGERNLLQRDGIEMLLKAYELEKALYELQYELSHRPTWTHIPLRATLDIISSV
jgi:maltose alpha-D-glucosyltransferase/alpha-amylase